MAKNKRAQSPTRRKSANRSKSVAKKPARKRMAKPKTPRLRPIDRRIQERLAVLGISPIVPAEQSSQIHFELEQQQALRPTERSLLFQAAKEAMEAAILASDDPEDWLKAGREAARL
jgi:hypothetical protein